MAVRVGFEPTERCSRSRFSKPAHLPLCQHTLKMAGTKGFEPLQNDLESFVLPLHQVP